MIGAFRHVVPGTHQPLKLREGRVDFPGHGALLGFVPDNLDGQLPEIAQHRSRELENLDILEVRLEFPESDGVLHVVVGEAIDLHNLGRMVECPP